MDRLQQERVELPPLYFRFLQGAENESRDPGFDALVEFSWLKENARFAVECKALSTPKAFKAGLIQLKSAKLYLELMAGDKRDQETAEQLKPSIKKTLESISG